MTSRGYDSRRDRLILRRFVPSNQDSTSTPRSTSARPDQRPIVSSKVMKNARRISNADARLGWRGFCAPRHVLPSTIAAVLDASLAAPASAPDLSPRFFVTLLVRCSVGPPVRPAS